MKKPVFAALFSALIAVPCNTVRAQIFSATEPEINAFVAADASRDGYLSLPEFRIFVQAMAKTGQPTAQTIRAFAAYRFAFGIVDANKDSLASPEELRAADTGYRNK
jgi:hypothetical protein